jgi:hypothetical protein
MHRFLRISSMVGAVSLLSGLLVAVQPALPALAAGTPITSCDPATVSSAIQAGGSYVFQCDGAINFTAGFTISTTVSLDATGHNVSFGYSNPVFGALDETRFADVEGGSLSLTHITLAGWSLSANELQGSANGTDGTNGTGGAAGTGTAGAGGNGTPGTAATAGAPGTDGQREGQ